MNRHIIVNILKTLNVPKMLFGLLLLLIIVFFACYYPTFQWLNYKYSTPDSYYSHGYLIPFVVLYLLYDKRMELIAINPTMNITGLYLIIFALIIHIFGVLSDVSFVSGFSMIIFLAGCSLFLCGAQFTKEIIFPLCYLIFMMPIPDEWLNIVALPSKSLATWFALNIMDLMNVPYIREGFSVILPNSTFIIGTPCNGLRSLISFFALGLLVIYFIRFSLLKSLLFLIVIPILAVILNGVRIATLLLIALYYGQEAASPESFLHDLSGLFVFLIGLIVMFVTVRVIYAKKHA